jgi:hypothetical protein
MSEYDYHVDKFRKSLEVLIGQVHDVGIVSSLHIAEVLHDITTHEMKEVLDRDPVHAVFIKKTIEDAAHEITEAVEAVLHR